MIGRPVLIALGCLLLCRVSGADAIVISRATQASTTAEIRVEEDHVRVELEIGYQDLGAFQNILPDELRAHLELEPTPLAERIALFFERDLVLRADGETLPAQLEKIEARRRSRRDEITGEPLGETEDVVICIVINYRLTVPPESLSIRSPSPEGAASANIGFVLYHRGLPVTDFRYLSREETVDLDWDDAWYSKFRNRNLRRFYQSPIKGFLYVDHFEVRKEIIVRPVDLQHWVDLGLDGRKTIEAGDRAEIERRAAEFLSSRTPVTVDGESVSGELDRIHFIRRGLRSTTVIDPQEDIDVISATLGVIFVYPVQGLPREATMRWDLFSPRIQEVPTVATDEAGGMPYTVTPDDPTLRWKNFLTNPSDPSMIRLQPPGEGGPSLPVPSMVCGLVAIGLLVGRKRLPGVALLVVALVLWPLWQFPLSGAPRIEEQEAAELTHGLLRNVYHAFDFRGEDAIYDTLARSASGDLLTSIYLDTRRALELANQGGARARVTEVEILEAGAEPLESRTGFRSRCSWIVTGSVGHWGHIHQRRNQYEAVLEIQPVEGAWKITALELLDERRL